MPPVFRVVPPEELVNQFLNCVGLSSMDDFTQFNKQMIQIEKFEELLPLLEPYYLPCKADDYLIKSSFTQNNVLTILRQMLKAHGASLKYSEKSSTGVKQTWYQIQYTPLSKHKITDITIGFD